MACPSGVPPTLPWLEQCANKLSMQHVSKFDDIPDDSKNFTESHEHQEFRARVDPGTPSSVQAQEPGSTKRGKWADEADDEDDHLGAWGKFPADPNFCGKSSSGQEGLSTECKIPVQEGTPSPDTAAQAKCWPATEQTPPPASPKIASQPHYAKKIKHNKLGPRPAGPVEATVNGAALAAEAPAAAARSMLLARLPKPLPVGQHAQEECTLLRAAAEAEAAATASSGAEPATAEDRALLEKILASKTAEDPLDNADFGQILRYIKHNAVNSWALTVWDIYIKVKEDIPLNKAKYAAQTELMAKHGLAPDRTESLYRNRRSLSNVVKSICSKYCNKYSEEILLHWLDPSGRHFSWYPDVTWTLNKKQWEDCMHDWKEHVYTKLDIV